MRDHHDILIVGAGHGGSQVAIALRHRGFAGTIAIVGEEVGYPYERPPLSKDYLAGEKSLERILIKPGKFWAERDITLLTGSAVVSIDPVLHTATTSAGKTLRYQNLIWAAGGHALRLNCPGHDAAGIHSIRSCKDVDRILRELDCTERIAVVGGGYIGLEAAATFRKLGKQVTVFEALDRVLARVTTETVSRFFEQEHRAHGVDLRLGTSVQEIRSSGGAVSGVRTDKGETIAAEMLIVGIGIRPSVDPLRNAGAHVTNGVVVDEYGRTSLQDVFALGDCALHPNSFADGLAVRLESVQNANDMASTIAGVITGEPEPYKAVPWFWSNQYDLRMQTVGLSSGHDQAIVRGSPHKRSFSVVYLKNQRVVALDCVNAIKDYVQGRALVQDRMVVDPAQLADPSITLKELAQTASQDPARLPSL
ncbi:FAD-dependent pyridine nucleotide-disulfide oxidoreductase [Burkholderia cenocepacia]|uniref:FAD-dependent pyridine nucleotide-disulfide oxidoreductase n=1 Tax=Burkholderia cenocepacia TaxID=95486 RepID=A0AAN0RVL9_9BURK|nr:FAD-dependent pyridine nucleotide-disulfide oxidoreductase [Burkholderia cenocepacia]